MKRYTPDDLEEAERRRSASRRALETHGHQGITWKMAEADARHREEIIVSLCQQGYKQHDDGSWYMP